MATRKYGISRGNAHYQVTEAVGAAVTDELELTFDLAATGITRDQVIQMLDKIKTHVLEGQFPPA